jgi:hypothetical protein
MQHLKQLATLHKLIYDVLSMLSNDEYKNEPFEIGVKCRSPDIQLNMYKKLTCVLEEHEDLKVEMKDEDNVVCVIKKKVEVVSEVNDKFCYN